MKSYYQRFPEDKDKDNKLGKKTPANIRCDKRRKKKQVADKWQTG